MLIFGSTTNSIVAVIAAFLGGLAVGSLIFGKITDRLSQQNLLKTYSLLELGIGASALLSLFLIPKIRFLYSFFSDGSGQSLSLTIIKFSLAILVLILPTILMGATLPVLVKTVTIFNKSLENSVSYLYAVNTFGATLGVLISGYVFIELFGLRNTILVAALVNFSLALVARFLKITVKKKEVVTKSEFKQVLSKNALILIVAFSLSGLVSIAYEVLWTRILTPTLGTFIYAFALILAVYLFGIAYGSLLYPIFAKLIREKNMAFAISELGIGFFALGSVYFVSNQFILDPRILMLTVLFPASVFMGLTFPSAVALISDRRHTGKIVGLTYFGNTIGSIIGGFIASFFLLRFIGSTQSIIFLSLVNFGISLIFILKASNNSLKTFTTAAILMLIIFTSWLFVFKRESLYEKTTQWRLNWAKQKGIEYLFKEDEVASTFGYHDWQKEDFNLFIDGVPTTGKVGETKLMAHIPILLHPDPHDVLVIALGMGTTFRSGLSYGYKTDVVELVPSIPQMMHLFHPDAQEVTKNPNGRIIINDGRNYVYLTKKSYDIVIIDPPPPFNAAGTTVLYSKEFYQEISQKLNPKGMVSQWIWFGSREDDIAMAIKSFVEVFPYVRAYQTFSGSGGIFLQGSLSPILIDQTSLRKKLDNQKANDDFREFYKDLALEEILNLEIGNRESLLKVVANYLPVTDDRPRTEYFKLRHTFIDSVDFTKGDWGEKFIKRIKNSNSS